MTARSVDTPRYVLLEGQERIGPMVTSLTSEPECVAVFGFSDKQPYDAFCANSPLALTPYPLVKDYLRSQMALPGDTVYVIVVDAAGPSEAHLNAATMSSVLEAQEQQAIHVEVSFQLTLNPESQAYSVEKAPTSFDAVSGHANDTHTGRHENEVESTET